MLVLSRKKNQEIIIGENIVLTIIEIRGDKVRLGIDAPNEIPVHRREIYEAIKKEQEAQAENSSLAIDVNNTDAAQSSGGKSDNVARLYYNFNIYGNPTLEYDPLVEFEDSNRSYNKVLRQIYNYY